MVLQSFSFIFFISADSPVFAQVEQWFSLIKRKLKEIYNREDDKVIIIQNYTKIIWLLDLYQSNCNQKNIQKILQSNQKISIANNAKFW